MSYKDAVKRLNDYGFTNVDPEYIEDEAPKDQVIGQSVSEGMELDVKTNIVLTVSKGPVETKPTEPEPEETSRKEDEETT
jgi:beta-lactam-binding protein with PASTA domain